MGKVKSAIVTIIIMALVWWVYVLTDLYAWAAHEILESVLVVAGMICIGVVLYVFLRLSNDDIRLLTGKRKKESWEQEYNNCDY